MVLATFKAALTEHIPIHLFTNVACRDAMTALTKNPDSAFTIAQGRLISKAMSMDSSKERFIEVISWTHAARRMVRAMRQHLFADGDDAPGGPNANRIADALAKHFSNIQIRPDFKDSFHIYKEYDITLRRTYVHDASGFDPATWQQATYNAILQDQGAKDMSLFLS